MYDVNLKIKLMKFYFYKIIIIYELSEVNYK